MKAGLLRSLLILMMLASAFSLLSFLAPTAKAYFNGQTADMVIGQGNFTSNLGGTSSNRLNEPYSIALDSSGNLWVADTDNSRVLEFRRPFSIGMNASLVIGSRSFNSVDLIGPTSNSFDYPHALAFDSSGDLWVSDTWNSRILEFVPPFFNHMNATRVIGQRTYTSSDSCSPRASALCYPEGVTFDSVGNLWVADSHAARVLEFIQPLRTGMNASIVLGQPNFTSETCHFGGPGSFCEPQYMFFDSSGALWVSDEDNGRVLKFSPPFADGMNASLALGQPDFFHHSSYLSPNCLLTPTSICSAMGIAYDGHSVWVADLNAGRVLEFSPPFQMGMPASVVVGQSNFTSLSGKVGTSSTLWVPRGIALDACGNLWVADTYENRIVSFNSEGSGTFIGCNGTPGFPVGYIYIGLAGVAIVCAAVFMRFIRKPPKVIAAVVILLAVVAMGFLPIITATSVTTEPYATGEVTRVLHTEVQTVTSQTMISEQVINVNEVAVNCSGWVYRWTNLTQGNLVEIEWNASTYVDVYLLNQRLFTLYNGGAPSYYQVATGGNQGSVVFYVEVSGSYYLVIHNHRCTVGEKDTVYSVLGNASHQAWLTYNTTTTVALQSSYTTTLTRRTTKTCVVGWVQALLGCP